MQATVQAKWRGRCDVRGEVRLSMCDLPLFGGHGLAVRKGVRRMPHEKALPRVLVVIGV